MCGQDRHNTPNRCCHSSSLNRPCRPSYFDCYRIGRAFSAQLKGRWPKGIRGSFFRNGPGQHERGGQCYHHWFDGDGLIQRWQIGGGQVAYKGQFVTTHKRQAEIAAGQFLYPAGGGGIIGSAAMRGPDSVNADDQ